jgi:predicted DNA-binding transcriptional regulator YafY
MCWHIFTWGPSVEIVSPEGLRTQLQEMLAAALRHHA